jgi:hypothetical protein
LEWFPEFVQKYLSFTGKCYRHCDKPTSMKILSQTTSQVIGAYVCPDGFVSQVVYFSPKPDLVSFRNLLEDHVGKGAVSSRDIRIATRHGWELGANATQTLESSLGLGAGITEAYWRRYPKTEEEKQQAVSLCRSCNRLFIHSSKYNERNCPLCQRKQGRT